MYLLCALGSGDFLVIVGGISAIENNVPGTVCRVVGALHCFSSLKRYSTLSFVEIIFYLGYILLSHNIPYENELEKN